eukprot:m.1188910 g.1188910  ORF g.1188910 m.1188910 type:complete len:133 (+) comp24554_c3_seq10:3717-4115(+)
MDFARDATQRRVVRIPLLSGKHHLAVQSGALTEQTVTMALPATAVTLTCPTALGIIEDVRFADHARADGSLHPCHLGTLVMDVERRCLQFPLIRVGEVIKTLMHSIFVCATNLQLPTSSCSSPIKVTFVCDM